MEQLNGSETAYPVMETIAKGRVGSATNEYKLFYFALVTHCYVSELQRHPKFSGFWYTFGRHGNAYSGC